MSTRRLALSFVLLLGCRHTGEAEGRPSSGGAWVRGDLQVMCRRHAERSMSAWSQPTYLSEEVRDLAIAVDQGDGEARCRLAALMQWHRLSECHGTASALRESCRG